MKWINRLYILIFMTVIVGHDMILHIPEEIISLEVFFAPKQDCHHQGSAQSHLTDHVEYEDGQHSKARQSRFDQFRKLTKQEAEIYRLLPLSGETSYLNLKKHRFRLYHDRIQHCFYSSFSLRGPPFNTVQA